MPTFNELIIRSTCAYPSRANTFRHARLDGRFTSVTSKSILTAFLALLVLPAAAGTGSGMPARRILVERFPDSLEESRNLSFCPDNTCIRVRSANADADLEGWLFAYLFHFGDYYALSDWRADIGSPDRIQGYPDALRDCFRQPDPMGCSKAAFEIAGISVVDVRYDEGQMSEVDAWDPPASGDTTED
jgi:hypothetical protein